jgi:hypothetical protein
MLPLTLLLDAITVSKISAIVFIDTDLKIVKSDQQFLFAEARAVIIIALLFNRFEMFICLEILS